MVLSFVWVVSLSRSEHVIGARLGRLSTGRGCQIEVLVLKIEMNYWIRLLWSLIGVKDRSVKINEEQMKLEQKCQPRDGGCNKTLWEMQIEKVMDVKCLKVFYDWGENFHYKKLFLWMLLLINTSTGIVETKLYM